MLRHCDTENYIVTLAFILYFLLFGMRCQAS